MSESEELIEIEQSSSIPAVSVPRPPTGGAEDPMKELVVCLGRIEEAVAGARNVEKLAKTLASKGVWDTFVGVLSGGNDKDLAEMVRNLAESMAITQSVLNAVIKAQTHKCVVLRSFSSAITQRILDLQIDTRTLDQGQRDVAVAILNDLKAHVAEQIRHQELVEQHAQEISTLVGASECHSSALYELDGRVTGIEAAVGGVVDRLSDYEDVVERGRGIDRDLNALVGRLQDYEVLSACVSSTAGDLNAARSDLAVIGRVLEDQRLAYRDELSRLSLRQKRASITAWVALACACIGAVVSFSMVNG